MINMPTNSKLDTKLDLLSMTDVFLDCFDKETYSGYSVYDAFNSPILNPISKVNIKLVNVIITQIFKRVPFNIRGILGVKKSINPKSLGLVLKAKILLGRPKQEIEQLYTLIMEHKNKDFQNLCWGYNWDYYTLRGGTFPKHFPNAIVTYFIGDALIDYYQSHPSTEFKQQLLSIRRYFLEDINRTNRGNGVCFSYSSSDQKEIYNASALITRYLYRLDQIFQTGDSSVIEKSINYLINVQNPDGSWYYGYEENQKWIDSFHSEYMLEFFNSLSEDALEKFGLKHEVEKANQYYLKTFFQDGVCNYFPNKKYPVNIHSIASRVIYLANSNKQEEAKEIIEWSFKNLYNCKKKAFYFEKKRYFNNKNIYHRWNQAWMYLALSNYKKAFY